MHQGCTDRQQSSVRGRQPPGHPRPFPSFAVEFWDKTGLSIRGVAVLGYSRRYAVTACAVLVRLVCIVVWARWAEAICGDGGGHWCLRAQWFQPIGSAAGERIGAEDIAG